MNKKIYLDNYFFNDVNSGYYNLDKNYNHLPGDCDVIGISFNSNYFLNYLSVVDKLLAHTRKLLIVVQEPTESSPKCNFQKFIETLTDVKIEIYGVATINFPSRNYQTIVPWFDDTINYYAQEDWAKYLMTQLDFSTNKPCKFDALLGRSRWHRDIIHDLYTHSSYRSEIIYSYFGDNIDTGLWDLNLRNTKNTYDDIDYLGKRIRLSIILPVDIYNKSYYSIISETTCVNSYSHYTEKTAKALIAGRPFVMFSGQYFLRNLRSLGFQTFDSVIDETYDNIENHADRFSAAWTQVEKLCQLDPVEVMDTLKLVLEHNQKHFLETDWHAAIRQYLYPLSPRSNGSLQMAPNAKSQAAISQGKPRYFRQPGC
jgi:hypothetical protein